MSVAGFYLDGVGGASYSQMKKVKEKENLREGKRERERKREYERDTLFKRGGGVHTWTYYNKCI